MARYIDAVKTADIISEKLNIPLGDLVDIFADIPNTKRKRWGEVKYNLQLNEEQIQNLIWGMDLAIDRCCTDEEEKPFKELMELLKGCIRR